MNLLADVICGAVKESGTQTGSDYTAKVTRVEGSTAYVQITGSDIADTPVAMSISAKAGDMVRVRVADGKAWITGNDTAPPSDNTELLKAVEDTNNYVMRRLSDGTNYSEISQKIDAITLAVGNRMKTDMTNRESSITISQGLIQFLSNTIKITSSKFTLDENGNATFAGELSAATGTFSGNITITRSSGSKIYIGRSDVTQSIRLQNSNNTKYSEIGEEFIGGSTPDGSWSLHDDDLFLYNGSNITWIDSTGIKSESDSRVKTDISDIDSSIAKQLRPVKFRFKSEPKDTLHYGFIAQEVEPFAPCVVKEMPNGYLGLAYSELIAPILALVQEQEKRITRLEEQLKALEEKK